MPRALQQELLEAARDVDAHQLRTLQQLVPARWSQVPASGVAAVIFAKAGRQFATILPCVCSDFRDVFRTGECQSNDCHLWRLDNCHLWLNHLIQI